MVDTEHPGDYAQRARMHEQLAEATADDAARKMHLSMAEAYRRKAHETGGFVAPPGARGPTALIADALH
jgi:hypothetical protein